MDLAIETHDLTKRFRKTKSYREILLHPFEKQETTALQSVSFDVQRGETFALVGPNGAGKTTLIKILSTLVLPTAGRAIVAGHDVRRHPAGIRRRVGCVVAEERSFYWRLTGRQNLHFFAVLNNIPKPAIGKRVDEVLRQVGLERQADKTFKAYSTGMKQRLAIARALLTDPEILLFDEPTRSLDRPTSETTRNMIADFAAQAPKKTVFFATHDLLEAEQLAARIAIMFRGEIKACGSLAELTRFVHTKKAYGVRLARPNERAVQLLRRLAPPGQPAERKPEEKYRFTVEIGHSADISTIIRNLVLGGAEVVECAPLRPSLADVYDSLAQGEV